MYALCSIEGSPFTRDMCYACTAVLYLHLGLRGAAPLRAEGVDGQVVEATCQDWPPRGIFYRRLLLSEFLANAIIISLKRGKIPSDERHFLSLENNVWSYLFLLWFGLVAGWLLNIAEWSCWSSAKGHTALLIDAQRESDGNLINRFLIVDDRVGFSQSSAVILDREININGHVLAMRR